MAGCLFYSYGSYYGGRFEAHLDVLSGSYSIRVYGTQDVGIVEYKDILSNEYGIEMVAVGGCLISRELREKSHGYNDVMEAAIEKRYGKGILERLWRRGQSAYERTREPKS
ncbi:MAG TPA: hypothetical protein VF074_00540 [Pyrinomonadaceae bacterium]